MGRGINQNRKISGDRVGKLRKPKNKILIAVEGKNKTEKIYFNNFENGKRSYNITYARGNNTDPLKLVQMLIKEINELKLDLKNDKAFCIFDIDTDFTKTKIIKDAIQLAKNNDINVITSTPCFELWFLLHYGYTTKNMNGLDVIKKLRSYYSKYEKNINIYPEIVDNLNIAINRAEKLEKYQIENNYKIGSVLANPNTEVYKIVDYLVKN